MNHPITFTIEAAGLASAATTRHRLAELERRLRESEVAVDLGRHLVADVAGKLGFFAHVGGHHVAIHLVTGDERLVLITADSPDWQ